ncbi:MAG: hypothetical protein KGN84_10650 [Acidobacteriota bacterium]|nr:hypothetical protein [Acidobacteriota bacterium]
MSFFPQLASGVVTQLPFRRTRNWRAIANVLESGEQISLADPDGGAIAWKLRYSDLTDAEVQSLSALFSASNGSYGSFTFVDPLANLIAWSEDLSRPDWQPGQLTTAVGLADPLGTQRASVIANPSAGAQQLSQTLAIPGNYVACFSVWLRSDTPTPVTLQRDGVQNAIGVTSQWKRYFVTGTGVAGAAQSAFSVAVAAGHAVICWGFQVEAQPYPSTYRQTQQAFGIYEETYFVEDSLTIANTAPGLSSCDIDLISRV